MLPNVPINYFGYFLLGLYYYGDVLVYGKN
jgi:hypothetical protein